MSEKDNVAKETKSNVLFMVNVLLAVLVAVLSSLIAFGAYKSAEIDSTSTDNYFLAQSYLNEG